MSAVIDALEELADDIQSGVEGIRERVGEAVQERQEWLARELNHVAAPFLSMLRDHYPIISTPPFALVLGYEDVIEVLRRHDRFSVALYTPKMLSITGPFILGEDDTELYRHDDAAVKRAMRREDAATVEQLISRHVHERLATVGDGETVDVVELTDHAVAATIGEYFGVPGPDPGTLTGWAKILFHEIFINVRDDEDVTEPAMAAAAEMRPYVDELIERRRAELAADGTGEPPDVLGRMIALQGSEPDLTDIAIRHNLIGLITGWVPTVAKSMALLIDELLDRPQELAGACAAARAGDRDLVSRYVFETLRFRPQNSGLLRKCEVDTVLAENTARSATIARGATVFVGTQAAMMDPSAFPDPDSFRLDRPYDSYLHFGHGLHRCIGEPFNRVQLPAITAALLERGISRHDDEIEWDGPFPSGLRVRLGA